MCKAGVVSLLLHLYKGVILNQCGDNNEYIQLNMPIKKLSNNLEHKKEIAVSMRSLLSYGGTATQNFEATAFTSTF